MREVTALGEPPERPSDDGGPPAGGDGETDLTVAVEAIATAAAASGREPPAPPWLPPLPPLVSLPTQLTTLPTKPTTTVEAAGSPLAVQLGLADRPAEQAQPPFVVDLGETGSLLVAGAVRSGRSTAIRTLAAGLAAAASPADVHLYAIDCGNRALDPLAELPHCGAVVDGDAERVERLLGMLGTEIQDRQRRLASGGFGALAEQRAADPAAALPYVVVLLDRMEAFFSRYAELDGGRLLDQVELLLRLGPAAGVTFVISADRTGFTHRIGSAVAARLELACGRTLNLLGRLQDQHLAETAAVPSVIPASPTG